jgi:membrane protein
MKKWRKAYDLVLGFTNKMGNDRVRAHSAEASFFAIMSFIPILMLLLTMIQYTPITEEQMMITLEEITPFEVMDMLKPVVNSLYRQSAVVVPWIVILALWTAGKSIIGITDGLNAIYRVGEERNYVILRIRAMLYALVMSVALVISLTILVFGYDIVNFLKREFSVLQSHSDELTVLPTLVAMLLLVFLFAVIYAFLPNRKQKFLKQLPGAIFASVSWTLFSYVFSIYLSVAGNMSVLYGSLTSLIGIMMWLYCCMYLLFIGAEINHYLMAPELFGQ